MLNVIEVPDSNGDRKDSILNDPSVAKVFQKTVFPIEIQVAPEIIQYSATEIKMERISK